MSGQGEDAPAHDTAGAADRLELPIHLRGVRLLSHAAMLEAAQYYLCERQDPVSAMMFLTLFRDRQKEDIQGGIPSADADEPNGKSHLSGDGQDTSTQQKPPERREDADGFALPARANRHLSS